MYLDENRNRESLAALTGWNKTSFDEWRKDDDEKLKKKKHVDIKIMVKSLQILKFDVNHNIET